MALTIDEMLKKIGEFRQYQWYLISVLGVCLLAASAFNTMVVSFITAEPDWKCVDGYMNNTVCRFNTSITLTSDDYKARCKMPREAWAFVDDFTSIVTEYDLVCDDSILLSIAQSFSWVGMLIALLLGGYLADKYGRRKICSLGVAIIVVAAIIVVFPRNFVVFVVCRFFIGIGSGLTNASSFPLLMEFTTERYRSSVGNGFLVFWFFGLMLLPLIGYFVRDWRMFLLATALSSLPCLFLYWLLPESPRWLLLKNKEKEARQQLLKVAKMNKKELPEEELEKPVSLKKRVSFRELFSSWKVTKITLISWDLWFTDALAYYGVTYSSVDLGGNRYLNFFLIALVGLPAVLSLIWFTNRFGRKFCVVCGFIIAGVAFAISIAVSSDQSSASVGGRVTASVIANFFVSFAFAGSYIWTVELYPTVIRSTGLATASAIARIGSFTASYVVWLIRIHPALPYGILAFICLQAAFLAFFLPETKGAATLETMDDMKKRNKMAVALVVNGDEATVKEENEP